MTKKYIHYSNRRIYAIYYRINRTLYINLDFDGICKIYILK